MRCTVTPDPHASPALAASSTASTWPSATCSPSPAASALTTASKPAVIACSIFIASSMSSRSPFLTTSPGVTNTRTTLPDIGAARLALSTPSSGSRLSRSHAAATSRWRPSPCNEQPVTVRIARDDSAKPQAVDAAPPNGPLAGERRPIRRRNRNLSPLMSNRLPSSCQAISAFTGAPLNEEMQCRGARQTGQPPAVQALPWRGKQSPESLILLQPGFGGQRHQAGRQRLVDQFADVAVDEPGIDLGRGESRDDSPAARGNPDCCASPEPRCAPAPGRGG
jgi:hypothetical protein